MLVGFARFWYDFIVGDDWTIAAGVVISLIITYLVVQGGIAAWWVLPIALVVLLVTSLWRATRPR
ncbi:MAG TPA: hypothetical protein VFL82_08545 [Thermomicrobiales bacterium]|jgi:hypothetical protein|nr:hypothetical protein [Thermomicrobiales bacterium]